MKSICQTLAACILILISLQLANAQNNSQSSPSSLLDDLLAPKGEQGSAVDQPPADQNFRTLGEELSAISAQMESAAAVLAGPKTVDAESLTKALQLQQDAINALSRLLQRNGGKLSKQISGDKSSEPQPSDVAEPNQPKDSPPGTQPDGKDPQSPSPNQPRGDKPGQQSSQSDSNPNSKQNDQKNPSGQTNGQDANGLPTKQSVVDLLKSIETSGQANWGKLPQRLRDQMQNSGSLEFTPGYERQTRDYFRNLNEALLKMKSAPSK